MSEARTAASPVVVRLEAEARHHRDRLALYRARMYGGKTASVQRLRELERVSEAAAARLATAR